MSTEAATPTVDVSGSSLTELHQRAAEEQQEKLRLAKDAIISVMEQTGREERKTISVADAAAAKAKLPVDLIETAILMLESGGRIRWNGSEVRYELTKTE